MKSVFTFLISFVLSVSATESSTTNFEKYQANKRSPVGAVALNLIFPGIGNYYANRNIPKTIIYPALTYGTLTTGLIVAANEHFERDATRARAIG